MTDIARLAEVKLPAVSNWRQRHSDTFPRSEPREGKELFQATEIAAWLDSRKIATNDRREDESPGTTYGMRFRRNLKLPGKSSQEIGRTLWPLLDKFRAFLDISGYADLVLGLLYIRAKDPARWTELTTADSRQLHALVERVASIPGSPLAHLHRAVSTVLSESDGYRRVLTIIQVLDHALRQVDQQADWGGPVFDDLAERFADQYGKHGSVIYTPRSVVRVLAEVTAPKPGDRVLDPCCDSGQFLLGAGQYVRKHGGPAAEVSLAGQALQERAWSLAKMTLELHGFAADLAARPGLALVENRRWASRFDVVMANPPFNVRNWGRPDPDDPRWRYGVPPASNANFAWLQHVVSVVAPGGRAAVVMPNGASFTGNDRRIRAAMVEDGVVEAVVALPRQLFAATAVPVNVWLLRSDGRRADGEVLFVDARALGMVTRARRDLSDADIRRIAAKLDAWRHRRKRHGYHDERGFAASVQVSELRENEYLLLPSTYVGTAVTIDSAAETVIELRRRLAQLSARANEIDMTVDRYINRIVR